MNIMKIKTHFETQNNLFSYNPGNNLYSEEDEIEEV